MRNYKKLFLFVLIILIIITLIQLVSPVIGGILASMLTTLATIIGFVTVFFEMKRSADIDECNFILETYKHFTSDATQSISIIFEKLDLLFYEGIFKIYPEWSKYRITNNKKIPFDKTPLCK